MANIYVGDSYGCLSDLLFSWENLHCSFFLELVQTFLDNQLQPDQSPLLVPWGPWLYLERTNRGYGPWPAARTLNYPPYSGKTISKNILRQHRWLILLKLWVLSTRKWIYIFIYDRFCIILHLQKQTVDTNVIIVLIILACIGVQTYQKIQVHVYCCNM